MNEKIGKDAGLVWTVLNDNGTKTVKGVKELTNLNEKEIYAAIGWLAREEKLAFNQKGRAIHLSLVK
jgi:hypothetical protein